MRRLGTLPTREDAQLFEDYLLTRGIKSQTDPSDGQWVVWVYDEDRLAEAREQLTEFQANPQAERYREAGRKAQALRDEAIKKAAQARKNLIDVRRRWERPTLASIPVTFVLILASLAATAAGSSFKTLWELSDNYEPVVKALSIAPYEIHGRMIAWDGLGAVARGQVWRLVTPIFIHMSLLHILFNMLMLHSLGGLVESRRGSLRYFLIVLVLAVSSNLGQYFWAGPQFGGMSGVVYGLFGYIWMKSLFDPGAGFYLHPTTVYWLLGWFILCIAGVVGQVANAAHGVGLLVGMAIGSAPAYFRRS